MLRTSRSVKRHAQRLIGWAAAYALLLQLVLIGALAPVTAHVLTGGTTPICGTFSDLDAPSDLDASGGAPGDERATVHCPLCLARADAVILPPPPPVTRIARVARDVVFRPVVEKHHVANRPRPPSQPRAPPLQA